MSASAERALSNPDSRSGGINTLRMLLKTGGLESPDGSESTAISGSVRVPSTYSLHFVHAWLSDETDFAKSAVSRVGISFPPQETDGILPVR